MRAWVHVIWRQTNRDTVLQSGGPRENEKFERLLHQHGERITAYAWYLYVNSSPRAYNLEPVKHVDRFVSKAGNTIVNSVEDHGAITRFPLSAFASPTGEGFFVTAMMDIREIDDWIEAHKVDGKFVKPPEGLPSHLQGIANRVALCDKATKLNNVGVAMAWNRTDFDDENE